MNSIEVERIVLRKVVERCKWLEAEGALPERRLDEVGLDSMGVLALLVGLETEAGLDLERVTRLAPPTTVADLIQMAVYGCDPSIEAPESDQVNVTTH